MTAHNNEQVGNEQVGAEPMGTAFAKTMEILTWIGLVAMIVPGIAYFVGIKPFADIHVVAAHWGEPASQFWAAMPGAMSIDGYHWFLGNLGYMDMLCVAGVAILALVPFFSIMAALARAQGPYRIILFVLLLEFAFAIFKPLIMAGGGE